MILCAVCCSTYSQLVNMLAGISGLRVYYCSVISKFMDSELDFLPFHVFMLHASVLFELIVFYSVFAGLCSVNLAIGWWFGGGEHFVFLWREKQVFLHQAPTWAEILITCNLGLC